LRDGELLAVYLTDAFVVIHEAPPRELVGERCGHG